MTFADRFDCLLVSRCRLFVIVPLVLFSSVYIFVCAPIWAAAIV